MSNDVMVIRLASTLRKSSEWMTFTHEQRSEIHTLPADAPLAQLAEQPGAENVHLLVPPEKLLFRQLTLPKAKYKLTPQTIQWLTEETLPDSAVVYHWSLIQRSDVIAYVVGIACERLEEHIHQFHTAGLNITRVLPDGCYLPCYPQSWTFIQEENSWLIRPEEHAFNELDEGWVKHLIQQFQPDNICSYGHLPADVTTSCSLVQHAMVSPLTLYVPDDAQTQRYNMLQGAFQPLPGSTRNNKWLLRLAALSIVLAMASFIFNRGYALWQLNQIEAVLTQNMQDAWHSYFPAIKRSDNFRFYFARQLTRHYPAAVPLLHRLEIILQAQPGIHLTAVNYNQQKKSLTLTVAASSEAEVETFCQTMKPWLVMEKRRHDTAQSVWILRSNLND